MGTRVWKEVLCLGRHYDPQREEWYEFTDRDIKDGHRNFQKMRKRGVPVPACWEHQDIEAGDAPPDADGIAEWKRAYARYTFAHLEDSRINDRGNLEMLHDVANDDDLPRLHAVKYVSPKVYKRGYYDSKGGEYTGATIAHVAATPTPRQHWQQPFAVKLSADDVFFFSYSPSSAIDTPEIPEREEKISAPSDQPCPASNFDIDAVLAAYAREDAENTALALSSTQTPSEGSDMADESEQKDPPKKDGDGDGKRGEGKEKNSDLKLIIDAIKEAYPEAKIPDEVSNWSELALVLKAQAGSGEPEPAEVPEAEPATEPASGGPPMVMSTLDKDSSKRAKANAWAKEERTEAKKRIEAALKTGRDPLAARKLIRRVEQSESVEMSFTDGEPSSGRWKTLLADIETYEKSQPKIALKPDGTASSVELSSVERPNLLDGGDRTKEMDECVKEQAELARRYSVVRPTK